MEAIKDEVHNPLFVQILLEDLHGLRVPGYADLRSLERPRHRFREDLPRRVLRTGDLDVLEEPAARRPRPARVQVLEDPEDVLRRIVARRQREARDFLAGDARRHGPAADDESERADDDLRVAVEDHGP